MDFFSLRRKPSNKNKKPWSKKLKGNLPNAAKLKALKFNNKKNNGNGHKQTELDKKLVYSLSQSRIPSWRQLRQIKRFLSPRELLVIRICVLVIMASILGSGIHFYFTNLEVRPVPGGEYIEGLIGSPKYINPLYSSISDVDNDLSRLVYSSLFRRGSSGQLVPDLALNHALSEEDKVYTIDLRTDAAWHDGTPVTADDVIFTFNAIKDNLYKSNLKNSFVGVEAERLGDYQVKFVLADPYAAFLELLTFGIMPANLWAQIPPESASLAELNLKPMGSGPYRFSQLVKDKLGNIREYELKANENYYGGRPYVDFKFIFHADFSEAIQSLNNNIVDGISYLPPELRDNVLTPKSYNFHKLYLPQLTVVFFNQENNPALGDKALRQALAHAIDRNQIVNDILGGDAYIVHSPILANSFAYNHEIKQYDYAPDRAGELLDNLDWRLSEISEQDIAGAEALLEESESESERADAENIIRLGPGEWRQKNGEYLVVNLKTVSRNENEEILRQVKEYWEDVGVKTEIEVVPLARVQSDVVKPRNFDALFYGLVLGSDPDPYAFWHSSQAGEHGFNISDFKNNEADQLLEEARQTSDQGARQEKYVRFQEIIAEEVPAIFMYSPVYTYVQTNRLKGFNVSNIQFPRDRFANVTDWYLETGKKLVWPEY